MILLYEILLFDGFMFLLVISTVSLFVFCFCVGRESVEVNTDKVFKIHCWKLQLCTSLNTSTEQGATS